jgi:hypothetical protein
VGVAAGSFATPHLALLDHAQHPVAANGGSDMPVSADLVWMP